MINGPLSVASIAAVSPNPRNTAVSTIDVTFSEPVNLTTFTSAALSLTDNSGANLITSAASISLVSGSTYEIGGLSGLTAAEGEYKFTVDSSSIQDSTGNSGSNSLSTSWLMDTTAPDELGFLAAGPDHLDKLPRVGHRQRPEWGERQHAVRYRVTRRVPVD